MPETPLKSEPPNETLDIAKMNNTARICALVITSATLLTTGYHAAAADLGPAIIPEQKPVEDGWKISVTPYFWVAGLSGDVGSFGLPSVHLDASFGDVWDNLDFAAMIAGEARRGPYSIFGDIIYSDLSGTSATPRGVVATDATVDSRTFAGLLGAGYTVLGDEFSHLDLVGGLRVWSAKTEVSFSGGLLDGREVSDSATWVDAMAGVRGVYSFTPNVFLTGWGLVGAGGADVDWDVAAALGYRFNETVSATLGYRALGVDYSNDGFEFDVVEKGPILGLTVKF